MINILKPFAALATHFKHNEFDQATIKLTLYYVLSTTVILLVSSLAILVVFAPPETEVPLRPEPTEQMEIEHDDWSLYEVREHLASVIFIIDVLILIGVSFFAYFFARKTLVPIQVMHEKQKQFLGDVAHELRTPLSVMQAGADTLLRRERTMHEYQEFVIDVQEEAARLTRVSNQFLHLLKTGDAYTASFKEVQISEVLMNEVKRFTPYANEHGITLISSIVPSVTAYTKQDALIEIVQNLLKNAIDYSNADDTVTLSLEETKTTISLTITDTGIGIPNEEQESIFDRFKKVDAARTPTKGSGTGLGLSIVKMLVSKVGGDITLKSELDIGTTIVVTLPKRHS